MGNILRIERCTGDLELTEGTITSTEEHTSCAGILLGPSLTVASTGDLTLTAGQRIVLRNGFSVATGGCFTAEVDPSLAAAEVRDFAYQDMQYYLTRADGPWGERDWTYDRIGNRLSETRYRASTPQQDSYLYEPNATSANSPILDEILLGVGGVRDYTWGPAGHLTQVASGGNQVDLTTDLAGRMSHAERSDGTTLFAEATFTYDGRSFLTAAADPPASTSVLSTYSSEGLLMGLADHTGATLDRRHLILYFAGAPVAQWTDTAGTESWQHLTTDHLGTPLVTTDAAGVQLWRTSLDPWGLDPVAGTAAGALENDVFLRLPGQWDSSLWAEAVLGTGEMYCNVHRWYQPGLARYSRPDPLGLAGWINSYIYGIGNPLTRVDPTGQQARGDAHIPSTDEIAEMVQRSCARRSFYRNYRAMREANWKKSDTYFHCKANCEATQCGDHGHRQACELSDARELFDQLVKEDPPSSAADDQAANRFGREEARQNPGDSCRVLCAQYARPTYLLSTDEKKSLPVAASYPFCWGARRCHLVCKGAA